MLSQPHPLRITPEQIAACREQAHRLRALAFRSMLRALLRRLAAPAAVRQPCWEPCPRHAETSGW